MTDQTVSAEEVASAMLFPDEGQPNEPPEPDEDGQQADTTEETDEQTANTEEDDDEGDKPESDDDPEQTGQAQAPADDSVVKWETATGETFEAPISELKLGYMRTADYTQKTQALADDRKQAEQALQSKVREAESYAGDLGRLATIGEQVKTYEAWLAQASQRGEDPQTIAQAQSQYLVLRQQHEDARGALQQKRQTLMQDAEQQHSQTFQQATQEALAHLGKVIPGFDANTHIPALREYGLKAGFTPEELAQTSDKRHFEILYKAHQWDQLQSKKPDAVARVKAAPPKTTKQGSSSAPPTAIDRANQRFKAKKDVNSLASLIASSDFVQ